ncbi:hypothetical protein [Bradyrhizobium sp. 25ACV]
MFGMQSICCAAGPNSAIFIRASLKDVRADLSRIPLSRSATFSLVSEIMEMTTCDRSRAGRRTRMTKVHERALTVESGEDLLPIHEWNAQRAKHFLCSAATSTRSPHAPRAGSFADNEFCLEDLAELGAVRRD